MHLMSRLSFRGLNTLYVLAIGLSLTTTSQADIYKYVDKNGDVFLTDRPEHPGYKLIMKTRKAWKPPAKKTNYAEKYQKNRSLHAPTIAAAAKRYRLPNALLHAVITTESAYNADAKSHAGAVGLMQLMPKTAQRYGVKDRRDAVANIYGGSQYLRDLLIMFENNLILALAAYNAGENAVVRYGHKIPPYEETQHYVKKVLKFYKQYRKSL